MRVTSCQQTACTRSVSTLFEVKDDDDNNDCYNNEHVIIGHYPLPLYCTKLYLLLARHLAGCTGILCLSHN